MEQIRKILAPTDLSEFSKVGVRYALNLAMTAGAEVTVYHVVTFDEIEEYGRELQERGTAVLTRPPGYLLEKYRSALAGFLKASFSDLIQSVKIREQVELGTADKNIVEEAAKQGTDLIVISTHGRTGLDHILMGSVTEKVVRHAPCPVLSIRPERGARMEERRTTASSR
jgi:nucleotide-binding universal stress UspA family protein